MPRSWSGAAIATLITIGCAQAQSPSLNMPFDVGNLPNPTAADWNDFAWQSFIAANWPVAAGTRGIPDSTQTIGAKDGAGAPLPVVWMTSKGINDVFLENGTEPDANWETQRPVAACASVPGYDPAKSYVLSLVAKTTPHGSSALNMAPFPGSPRVVGPLIDQSRRYVRYDIRMSQSEFTYFVNSKYYNSANQVADVTDPDPAKFMPPPTGPENYVQALPLYARHGAAEYKAAWRELDPSVDIVSRYFTMPTFVLNPDNTCEGPKLMGLVGLHIIRFTPATLTSWFWATFEHADNVSVPDPPPTRPNGAPLTPSLGDGGIYEPRGYSGSMPPPIIAGGPLPAPPAELVKASRHIPIQPASIAANTKFHGGELAGTFWTNYQLIGVQYPTNPWVNGTVPGSAKGNGACHTAGKDHANKPDAQINECFLSNVAMETYVQSIGCVSCHSYGTPLGVPRLPSDADTFATLQKFQYFTFMFLEAQPHVPDR